MKVEKMKILFYDAGVMGSLYAARLKESGQDISVLARGQCLAEIREHGIFMEDASSKALIPKAVYEISGF